MITHFKFTHGAKAGRQAGGRQRRRICFPSFPWSPARHIVLLPDVTE